MYHSNRTASARASVVIFLLLSAAPVAAQPPDSFSSNDFAKIAVKKNFRPSEANNLTKPNAEAVEKLRDEIRSSPADPVLYNNLGTVYALMKNYEEAIAALQKAIALKPDFSNAYFNLSIVYDHLERYPEAFAAVNSAIALDGTNRTIRIERCRLLLALRKFADAAPCYEQLVQAATAEPERVLRANYAAALMQSKQYEKALPVLQENIALFPNDPFMHNALGMLFFTKKKYKSALECFNRALALNADFEPARYNLAMTQLLTNDRDAALKQYARLKKTNPAFAAALYKSLYRDKVVFVPNP